MNRQKITAIVPVRKGSQKIKNKNLKKFAGKNFSEFKEDLSLVLVDKINPISAEIKKLLKDQDYLDKILSEGFEKADLIASKKIKKIKEIVGF